MTIKIAAFTDVSFDDSHERLKYDVFRPEGTGVVPWVTLIHGGGWGSGSRIAYHATGIRLAQEGYGATVIGYRLSPEVRWPEIGYDVGRGIAHVQEHADDYGLDSTKTVTWGASAGGHLALILQAWMECWTRDRIVGRSPDIVGTVAQCPVTKVPTHDNPGLGVNTFGPGDDPAEFSPINIAHSRWRSVLVCHGDQDQTVPLAHSEQFVERLQAHEIEARLEVFEGAPHAFGYDLRNEHAQRCMTLALPYLHEKLD